MWKVGLVVKRDGVVERADTSDASTARPHVLGGASSEVRTQSGVRPAAREGAATRAKLG